MQAITAADFNQNTKKIISFILNYSLIKVFFSNILIQPFRELIIKPDF